jgi:hypothetical protein
MSVLIPGDDPLRRRVCLDKQNWHLLHWFSTVESLAWEAVEARLDRRPDRIFLVMGQTLTTEYAITHQEYDYSGCEASVELKVTAPPVVGTNIFLGHGFQHASAAMGFEISAKKDPADEKPREYSVFLETHESAPITRLKRRSLVARLKSMHRYTIFFCFYVAGLTHEKIIFKKF